jgi:putative endonuclease
MDTGNFGENLAVKYLEKQGYKILSRNFRVRSGELDIVCRKGRLLVFVEVKTLVVKHEAWNVEQRFGPEQHFTKQKITRLKRAIEIFLIKNKLSLETEQRLDLIALELDESGKLKDLRHYENVSDSF